jgi:transposase-like protein
MYTREQKIKAINLYIKYDHSITAVIRELGYPSYKMMYNWYKRYLEEKETGVVWKNRAGKTKYSEEQRLAAVNYYKNNGKNFARTIRALGYPDRNTLREWCNEFLPNTRKVKIGGVQYSKEQKKEAVIQLCTRDNSAEEIANTYQVSRGTLYT